VVKRLFRVRPSVWKRIRYKVYERENGICQHCGLPVKEHPDDPDHITTDKPLWSVHHVIPQSRIEEEVRELCKNLTGQEYIIAIRQKYTTKVIDMNNLELRCNRLECRIH